MNVKKATKNYLDRLCSVSLEGLTKGLMTSSLNLDMWGRSSLVSGSDASDRSRGKSSSGAGSLAMVKIALFVSRFRRPSGMSGRL